MIWLLFRRIMKPRFLPLCLMCLCAAASPAAAETAPALAPATPAPAKATPKPKEPDDLEKLAATMKPSRQIVYKTIAGRELHMNLFEPQGYSPAKDKRACYVVIHGGGWTGGTPV